jgi:hypothetical protein
MRKYSCNHRFFSNDTPESFYWAGFLAADGFVRDSGGTQFAGLTIAVKDRVHLEKFVKEVRYTGIIEDAVWHQKDFGVSVRICSRDMFSDLSRFNIIPRKTLVYTFPKWIISHNLVNHFMRGYFDGDGSVYFINVAGKTKQCNFEILGTEDFVRTYSDIMHEKCDIALRVYKKKNIWCGRFCGNVKSQRARDFLYGNTRPDIMLERKYKRFFDDEIGQNKRVRKVVGTDILTGRVLEFDSISSAIKGGFGNAHISDCCAGKRNNCGGFTWKFA